MKYDIDFINLIPPLSKKEYDLLRKSILKDGCRDAIAVWTETLSNGEPGRTIILDGHNRYEICTKNKIQFETRHEKLKDKKEARIWVIQNQLGRRNLTDYQRGKLTLELKTMIQEKAKEKQKKGGKEKVSQKSVEAPIDTQKELAKLAGVSHDTIHKIEVIEKEATPEIKESIEKGEISVNKAYKYVRGDDKDRAEVKSKTKPVIKEISWKLQEMKERTFRAESQWKELSKTDKKKFIPWMKQHYGTDSVFGILIERR